VNRASLCRIRLFRHFLFSNSIFFERSFFRLSASTSTRFELCFPVLSCQLLLRSCPGSTPTRLHSRSSKTNGFDFKFFSLRCRYVSSSYFTVSAASDRTTTADSTYANPNEFKTKPSTSNPIESSLESAEQQLLGITSYSSSSTVECSE